MGVIHEHVFMLFTVYFLLEILQWYQSMFFTSVGGSIWKFHPGTRAWFLRGAEAKEEVEGMVEKEGLNPFQALSWTTLENAWRAKGVMSN